MRRKGGIIILIFSILALMCLFFVYPLIIKQNKRFNDCIINYKDFEKIKKERIETNQFNPSIEFNEQSLFREADTNIFYYSLVEGSSTARNPRINLDIETKEPLKIAFCNNKITDILLEKDFHIRFVIYSDECFQEFYLVCTTLPIMNINCEGDIGDADVNMTLYLFDNQKDCTKRITKSEGRIRIRGGITRTFPKKAYKINTRIKSLGDNTRENNISLLGLRQDNDWILDALYPDQEKVRNVFSQNLWKYSCARNNKYHIDAGTEYKYLELFVNGKYSGLYALGYPIDEKQLQLNGDITQEAIYKGINWLSIKEFDTSAFELKHVGELNEDEKNNMWQIFIKYFTTYNFKKNNIVELKKYIDLDNVTDIILFYDLVQGVDNVSGYSIKNNIFAMRSKKDGMGVLQIPWDLDMTWGNVWNGKPENNFLVAYGWTPKNNRVMKDLYYTALLEQGDKEAKEAFINKYRKLRKNGWSKENIEKMISEYEQNIFNSGAYRREIKRWPETSKQNPEYRLSIFREYVLERLSEMDKKIARYEENIDGGYYKWISSEYENFLNSDFQIEIRDKGILKDYDVVDLFNYIGIDTTKINNNITYIEGNRSSGYKYTNKILDEPNDETKIKMIFSYNGEEHQFDFEKDVTVNIKIQ